MRKLELDGLRAIAVLAVLYHHSWSESLNLGALGVRLFFVLSGFLITAILLQARSEAARDNGWSSVLATFYMRRALRIWPAYFLMIVALAVVKPDVRDSVFWHLGFLSNVLFVLRQSWSPGILSHLWTLAIEQQFYLVWPLVILLLPTRVLAPACLAFVAAGVAWRGFAPMVGLSDFAVWLLPPGSFDALAAGSLMAVIGVATTIAYRPVQVLALALAALGALSMLGYFALPAAIDIWLLPMTVLIGMAHQARLGAFGRVLRLAPVHSLGRISYGVYLFHLPIVVILKDGYRYGLPVELETGPVLFVVATALSVLVAAVSWLVMERPLNRLAHRTEVGLRRAQDAPGQRDII